MTRTGGASVCRFAHFAMGTTFELLLCHRKEDYGRQVSQAVFAEIDRIENLFSRFNPCSEIGQVNRLQPGQSMMIGVETYECLKTALWVYSQTSGAFDINIGSLIKCKEDKVVKRLRSSSSIRKHMGVSRTPRGYRVSISPGSKNIETGPVDLDLGGIGKGYALDKTLNILSDWSIDSALIHGGTSTALAVGSPPQSYSEKKGWAVGIGGNWNCQKVKREFLLRDRALSGSGTEVKGEHILDPRTGEPAKGHLAAWVSSPSAAVSDALSTAFMVMTTEEVESFCNSHPEVWALVIIDPQTCEVFNQNIAL